MNVEEIQEEIKVLKAKIRAAEIALGSFARANTFKQRRDSLGRQIDEVPYLDVYISYTKKKLQEVLERMESLLLTHQQDAAAARGNESRKRLWEALSSESAEHSEDNFRYQHNPPMGIFGRSSQQKSGYLEQSNSMTSQGPDSLAAAAQRVSTTGEGEAFRRLNIEELLRGQIALADNTGQDQIEAVLGVDDPDMKFVTPNDKGVEKLASHLRYLDDPNEAKPAPVFLIYGNPGSGKTRLLREIALATFDPNNALAKALSETKDPIDVSEFFPIAVSFNSVYAVNDLDFNTSEFWFPEFPVWSRLAFSYCQQEYKQFNEFQSVLYGNLISLRKSMSEVALSKSLRDSLNRLISLLLERSQRKRLLLLIDETVSFFDKCHRGDEEDFLRSLNRLQNPEQKTVVIFSGILDGPWLSEVRTSTGRVFSRYLIQPVDWVHGSQWLRDDRDLVVFARQCTATKPQGRDEHADMQALVQYLYSLTMGLPRAVEIMRRQLRDLFNHNRVDTLTGFVHDCADNLSDKYQVMPDFQLFSMALCGSFFIRGTQSEGIKRLHEYMSVGKCMVAVESEKYEYPLIPPLRLLTVNFGVEYEEAGSSTFLQHLTLLFQNPNPKSFEGFLMHHEMLMRLCRRVQVAHHYSSVKTWAYSSCTLLRLYFPDTGRDDGEFTWCDEGLKNELFDFTEDLYLAENQPFPTYSEAKKWINHVIVTPDLNQKGFEYGIILRSQEGRIVALLEQNKFTEIDAKQPVTEVEKSEEVVTDRPSVSDIRHRQGDIPNDLGWNPKDIIVLFRTNRVAPDYRPNKSRSNVILMCRESLKKYLGATMWNLLLANESLSCLKLSCSGI